MLVNKDEDTKTEPGANKEKESISVIFSIFKSIKHSEDIVDATKSKVQWEVYFYINNYYYPIFIIL